MALTVGTINPYRYKSYYYDIDTQLYYLQSRYYDAEVGRFVSADDSDYLGATGNQYSYNLYAYCEDDSVNYNDINGVARRSSKTYSGIVGFGIQVLLTAAILGYQGFIGFEAIWFAFTGNNNFGNGFMPWCYWFHGASMGTTLDFKKLLVPEILTSPKKALSALGLGFSCSISITCFLVTANKICSPSDYEGRASFWTGTAWGVTVSKAWSDNITTYGVGFSWEVCVGRWRVSIGKKLFGVTCGSAWYVALPLGKNAQSLYNLVRKAV